MGSDVTDIIEKPKNYEVDKVNMTVFRRQIPLGDVAAILAEHFKVEFGQKDTARASGSVEHTINGPVFNLRVEQDN